MPHSWLCPPVAVARRAKAWFASFRAVIIQCFAEPVENRNRRSDGFGAVTFQLILPPSRRMKPAQNGPPINHSLLQLIPFCKGPFHWSTFPNRPHSNASPETHLESQIGPSIWNWSRAFDAIGLANWPGQKCVKANCGFILPIHCPIRCVVQTNGLCAILTIQTKNEYFGVFWKARIVH